jgi:hypothetical protein
MKRDDLPKVGEILSEHIVHSMENKNDWIWRSAHSRFSWIFKFFD